MSVPPSKQPATSPEANKPPVVLVVGMSNSVHVRRWLAMMKGHALRIVLLPIFIEDRAEEGPPLVRTRGDLEHQPSEQVTVFDITSISSSDVLLINEDLNYRCWTPDFMTGCMRVQPAHVVAAVERLRPDIVHSMEIQFAGYVTAAAHRYMGRDFPLWLVSNWGSDIYLYRKIHDHRRQLIDVMTRADAYIAECRRDVDIVREIAFSGVILPPLPASGGVFFDHMPDPASLPAPSKRKEVLVKGYHGWAGRGLHVLSALHMAAPALRGYRIRISLASEAVRAAAEALASHDGLDVEVDDYLPSHDHALRRLSEARMVVGLGISDGISTTLLEAMTLGTFSVQATTSCACEWVEHGRTGMVVPPHDTAALARAVVAAATDDAMVDAAVSINRTTVEHRWNAKINGPAMRHAYDVLLGRVSAA